MNEYVVSYRRRGDKDAPATSETFIAENAKEAKFLAQESLTESVVIKVTKRKFSFAELKKKFENAVLTDEDLTILSETPGVWYEKIDDNYECRDMAVPAGEKADSFNFAVK